MYVTARPVSIVDLTRLGAGDIAHLLERTHPPATTLEWLGIAVGRLPELTARARTAEDLHAHSRSQRVELRRSLLDALMGALGGASAAIEQARARLLERHPDSEGDGSGADVYAELLEAAHRSAPRHAEMMIGGYAAFLGAAVETAGALAEAELATARAGRWERVDHETLVSLRAAQLHSALSNALGGLLAYARLVADDARRLQP
jgi:hypothetical protein